jgi:hypothetical protein
LSDAYRPWKKCIAQDRARIYPGLAMNHRPPKDRNLELIPDTWSMLALDLWLDSQGGRELADDLLAEFKPLCPVPAEKKEGFDEHAPSSYRIGHLLGDDALVRGQLGCAPRSARPVCAF